MPIEDVDFLLNNSTQTPYIIRADTSLRNKQLFPTPSEFSIRFSQPYHYVYGIDIIDTTMPATMWNIEYYNNAFKFHITWMNQDTYEGQELVEKRDFLNTYFIDLYSFPQIAQAFEKKRNNRILFIEKEHQHHFDNLLPSP